MHNGIHADETLITNNILFLIFVMYVYTVSYHHPCPLHEGKGLTPLKVMSVGARHHC